jgi:undecaprenyl-diphosphatase
VFTRSTGGLVQQRRERATTSRLVPAAVTLLIAYVALSAFLIVIGLVLVHLLAPVRHWDDHVNAWLAAHRTAGWTRASKDGTFLAGTRGVVVVAVVATLVALAFRFGRASALLLCGLGLELAVFLTVNYSVRRPRPVAPHVGSTPSTYSFPSGHAAATLVLYGGIAVLVSVRTRALWARALAWAVAACMVAWVGYSRVYSAEHHPTDVMAGICLGAGALAAAVIAVQPGARAQRQNATVHGVTVERAVGTEREEVA